MLNMLSETRSFLYFQNKRKRQMQQQDMKKGAKKQKEFKF